jgi:uncharacterized membrane protein YdcZ (DUF606 family)
MAAIAASLAAGPLALLMVMAVSFGEGVQGRSEPVAETLGVFLMAAGIGAILSIVPNLVGTLCLFQLSQHHPSVRPVPVWAVVGGLLGIPFAYCIGLGSSEDPGFLLLYALVGAACATICRLIAAPD